jgi:phosphatidylserine/phosphatidylglycerophosphate/cardiolipin synthase-like enzyme
VAARKLTDMRLHVRAIIRDGKTAFVGSQSLRKLELDGRREIGVFVHESRIAKKMLAIFEADWKMSEPKSAKAEKVAEKAVAKVVEKADGKANGRSPERYLTGMRRVTTPSRSLDRPDRSR